jgi:hypothetical protein
VEREVWFHDPKGTPGLPYVIVHIHFADLFDEFKDVDQKPQEAHTITSVNLRHYTTQQSKDHQKTSHYKSIFKNIFLEDAGLELKSFKQGSKGRV